MKTNRTIYGREQGGAMVVYLIVAVVVMGTIAALISYVVQNVSLGQRRQDMVNAYQFAQGGAALACRDLEVAFTNTSGTFFSNLSSNSSTAYTKNTSLSTSTNLIYERTIAGVFSNQSVQVQLNIPNSTSPTSMKVVATATVGRSTQTVQANLQATFGVAAAIISTAQGTSSSGVSKSTAQNGNVVVDGGSGGTTKVDGGIIANGAVNTNQCKVDSISEALYGTSSEIPDYTNPGSSYQLFDFNRFIAVANFTGQHYANLNAFVAKAKLSATPMEGVIVVDIPKSGGNPSSLSPSILPYGINIKGTLVFNFTGAWNPLDKIVNTADMNINAANLSGLVATNPATYTSGFPPTYTDPSKDPVGKDIKTTTGYDNFTASEALPALMYNNAVLDMHGDVNICGVVYSSSFMEIENKQDGQNQYFRGALIGGGGIYVENGKNANSIVSYDAKAVAQLATAGTRGKTVKVVFQK